MGESDAVRHDAEEGFVGARVEAGDSGGAKRVVQPNLSNRISRRMDEDPSLMTGDFRGTGVYASYYAAG